MDGAKEKEKILYRCKPSKMKVAILLFLGGMFLFSGAVSIIPGIMGIFVLKFAPLLGAIACIFIGFGIWKFANYCLNMEQLILTDRRIYGKTGIVTKRTLSSPINKIQTVRIRKTLFGKMFGYSDLEIHCITGVYWFKKQKNAERMQKAIFDLINKKETATEDSIKPYLAEIAKNTRKSGR